ncbi:hypothetical protein FS749_001673 [Ceratobasidium sp. UAMH 11750]|nr:hypothetical protein FS749_001673 [Ceratobasidium sp. UAMH 11750]
MSTTISFDSLPSESIIHILLFLAPKEIRKCQQVCRFLRNLVQDSPRLRYLLELDSLGYSAPLNPRNDLSYDEKIQVLRRMRNPPDPSTNIPFRIGLNTTHNTITNYQFARGVFAQGGPSLDVTRSLNLYRLASFNANTSYEQWHLSDLGVNAQDFKMDPDLDLLVLLETDAAPGDPEVDLVRRLHLRSLRTGLPHPLAAVPVIISTDKFTSNFTDANFQLVGRFVALLCHTNQLLSPDPSRISIWDWTTGDLVTFADVTGQCFTFVSDTCFVTGCSRRKYAKEIIGSLEVYTFDPSRPGRRARHVASLHLPTTPEGPCHSSFSFSFAPLGPLSFPANGLALSTVPPRIYDLSPSSHYICLKILAYNIQNHPSEMTKGALFIPATSIVNATSTISPRESQLHVPWENWARGTSWIHHGGMRGEKDHIFGQQAAFVRLAPNSPLWQILVYDLGSSIRETIKDPIEPPYEPSGAHLYLDRVFMGGQNGARNPRLVSLIAAPETRTAGLVGLPEVMVDGEHVMIYQVSIYS